VQFRSGRRGKSRGALLGDSSPPEHSLLRNGEARSQPDIEMQQATLPPQWVDSVEDAREDLKNIKEKLVQLTKVQQKRLLNVFSDDGQPDKDVEEISSKIGKLVRHCESCIHQVKTRGNSASDTDKAFRENAQRNLATHLQKLSTQFRQAQKDYLDEIRKRQSGGVWDDVPSSGSKGGVDAGFTEGQLLELDSMEVNASQRSEEICQIASSISELHTIFKELAVLVIDQGSILDRIDYNIEQVVTQSKEANKQLQKAEKSQKSNRATKCMLVMVLANAILILILIFKARH
jgi:syntaxin 16